MAVIIRWFVIISTILLVVSTAGLIGYDYWARPGWIGATNKEAWNYLDVLLVPVAVGLATIWFTEEQSKRQREDQAAQAARALAVENQRAQDAALQSYLDQMSQLLTDKEQPLHNARLGDSLSTLARARTLTVLPRLDGSRKASVVQFLYESHLIGKESRVVALKDADLNKACLRGAQLRGVAPISCNLTRADLREAILYQADHRQADLSNADLRNADLRNANLFNADLRNADLRNAVLLEANLEYADLYKAKLTGALFDWGGGDPFEAVGAGIRRGLQVLRVDHELRGPSPAKKEGITPQGDTFEHKSLLNLRIRRLNLRIIWSKSSPVSPDRKEDTLQDDTPQDDAPQDDTSERKDQYVSFLRANLSCANLFGAKISDEMLQGIAEAAAPLVGATMPNGQKYEDWLKEKESSGKSLTALEEAYLDWLKDKQSRGEYRTKCENIYLAWLKHKSSLPDLFLNEREKAYLAGLVDKQSREEYE